MSAQGDRSEWQEAAENGKIFTVVARGSPLLFHIDLVRFPLDSSA